jgi:hypothetical protein
MLAAERCPVVCAARVWGLGVGGESFSRVGLSAALCNCCACSAAVLVL